MFKIFKQVSANLCLTGKWCYYFFLPSSMMSFCTMCCK